MSEIDGAVDRAGLQRVPHDLAAQIKVHSFGVAGHRHSLADSVWVGKKFRTGAVLSDRADRRLWAQRLT
ncbi:hypothetical protein Lesp02_05660 [Lentzea sp. NBRC 105346]|nr:hypothetical protein Lesp02_05660 [Lentzea sp. NBRC 105346]